MNHRSTLFDTGYFLADGGLETTLIFHQGIALNHFAAFELLNTEEGKQALGRYYRPYLDLAAKLGVGYILETPTWRANPDWAYKLGYSGDELRALNKNAVRFLRELVKERHENAQNIVLSGCIGPRGDGYAAEKCMSAAEASHYHRDQVQAFALADVDVITGMTINYSDEAIGIIMAAKSFNTPVVISFTVETDGNLPTGETLRKAIEKTDAATDGYALHFMINCAHPEHFKHILKEEGNWKKRIRGIRANASTKSHAELDESETLDAGDKHLLAHGYRRLRQLLPDLRITGGCCGTDHSHLEKIFDMAFSENGKHGITL